MNHISPSQTASSLSSAQIVVLGAAGFIGRWVSRRLCFHGAKPVLVVRDVQTAKEVFADYEINGEIIQADFQRLDSVTELIGGFKPDVVFNLAGYGVDHSERDEEAAYRINAHLVETICKAMAVHRNSDWPGQNIVHVGSALEYGEIGGNLAEDSAPNPTTLYGQSKLLGTNLLTQFCRKLGVKGLTARLFTVYGPGEHEGRLLPLLSEAARNSASLPLTAGQQQRDFTFVEDVADILIELALAEASPGEIVNLATGKLTTVRGFVEIAAEVLHIPKKHLNFGDIPARAEEMRHEAVTIDRLRKLLGPRLKTPLTDIAEGIRRTKDFNGRLAERLHNRQERTCASF
mgnify:CR=1 FL=1